MESHGTLPEFGKPLPGQGRSCYWEDGVCVQVHGCRRCSAHWEEKYGDPRPGPFYGVPVWKDCPECGGWGEE